MFVNKFIKTFGCITSGFLMFLASHSGVANAAAIQICNTLKTEVTYVTGEEHKNEILTRSNFYLAPGICNVRTFPTSTFWIYAYSEPLGVSLVWTGPNKLCVKPAGIQTAASTMACEQGDQRELHFRRYKINDSKPGLNDSVLNLSQHNADFFTGIEICNTTLIPIIVGFAFHDPQWSSEVVSDQGNLTSRGWYDSYPRTCIKRYVTLKSATAPVYIVAHADDGGPMRWTGTVPICTHPSERYIFPAASEGSCIGLGGKTGQIEGHRQVQILDGNYLVTLSLDNQDPSL